MKKQIRLNRRTQFAFTVVVVAVLLFIGSFDIAAQDERSISARYGSRDPRTCENTKAPARGAITAALATKYLNCQMEYVSGGGDLYLVENLKSVEVGGGIPYAAIMGQRSFSEIDVKNPVYPIRGSFLLYQCRNRLTEYSDPPNTNCITCNNLKATGYCYKTNFGDWRCFQTELFMPNENIFPDVPPPTGENNAPDKTQVNEEPADTKNEKQPAKTDENGIVKPDFSELEKDFEIVRYEYDTSARPPAIYIVAKVKKTNGGTNALGYEGRFYDADGANVMLPDERIWAVSGDTSKAGEIVKIRVWTPGEKQMRDDVKRIVITRKLD